MALPVAAKLLIKAAVAVATDKKVRKTAGAIVIAVASPFILAIAVICVILGGGASHNSAAVQFAFGGGDIPAEAPEEYRRHLEDMRSNFSTLDELTEEKNEEMDEGSLNPDRVKALFFALHFGIEPLDFDEEYFTGFLNAFTGARIESGETITFALDNMGAVYSNMTDFLGRIMSAHEKANAEGIYNSLLYGGNIPDDTYSFNGYWSSGLADTDIQYLGAGAETQVVYFNQADERWGSESYGYSGTIASQGCGPTALAMVVSTLSDRIVNPSEMSAWAYRNGYLAEGVGSYHSLIPEGGRHFGLTIEGASRSEGQKVAGALAEGKLVIAIMAKGHFTNSGHFIVLRGITDNGQVLVADPASIRRSERSWDIQLIIDEASQRAGAGGPFWIFH